MIGITIGDPAGIGLETLKKSMLQLSDEGINFQNNFMFIGPDKIWKMNGITDVNTFWAESKCDESEKIIPGMPTKRSGQIAFQSIKLACDLVKEGKITSIMTLPVSKEWICTGTGNDFTGHTEYLANRAGISKFGMMLLNSYFAIYLITTHIPISDVSRFISKNNLIDKIQLLLDKVPDLEFLGNSRYKIAICSLNPHNGEGGKIGSEEIEEIIPAVKKLNEMNKIKITGPFPSDTLFVKALKKEFGIIICHYHDQALIPLKTTDPDNTVNVTVGLPYLRTSPGHGTAFDIAGKGIANYESTFRALSLHL